MPGMPLPSTTTHDRMRRIVYATLPSIYNLAKHKYMPVLHMVESDEFSSYRCYTLQTEYFQARNL
jgi:hypothetical protein